MIELLWKYEHLNVIFLCCWKSITKSHEKLPPFVSKSNEQSHKLCGNWQKRIRFNKLIWLTSDCFCEDNFATLLHKDFEIKLSTNKTLHGHIIIWNFVHYETCNLCIDWTNWICFLKCIQWILITIRFWTQMEELFGNFFMIF
jgi:hypothetical protein